MFQAFESYEDILNNLYKNGLIALEWQKNIAVKQLYEAKQYLFGDYKLHLKQKSRILDHCIECALSDPNDRAYSIPFIDHQHDLTCDRCNLIEQAIQEIRNIINELREDGNLDQKTLQSLNEYVRILEENEKRIDEMKCHQLRATFSEMQRLKMIDELGDFDAILTCDFAMKFLPTKAYESQKDWFGKAGISWHISHILMKKENELYQHSVVHAFDHEAQVMYKEVEIFLILF